MKFVLASKNPNKLREMREILTGLDIEVISEAEAGVDVEVEETGSTFEENSLLKAKAVCKATGLPAIADDSGLCVTALGGGPGVYSARYGGAGLSDTERYQMVLDSMRGQLDRTAKFVCCVCCAFPDGGGIGARGECEGLIVHAPRGEDGFGYDPIFLVSGGRKTFAQMTAEEKNAVSHRGKALTAFREKLGTYLKERGLS